jgi:hypothetical protein
MCDHNRIRLALTRTVIHPGQENLPDSAYKLRTEYYSFICDECNCHVDQNELFVRLYNRAFDFGDDA